ncbi:MAG: hypothetical protein BMS9Abin06_0683 [Gammaproteobacteria bacterium]|nr:MAG: hypothetical protein BMS9Abin06_0683 [Gammaproteobacteria bacterium]
MKNIAYLALFLVLGPGHAFAVNGKALYQRECVACHGLDGAANTKLGHQLKPLPARDLRPKILSRKEIRRVVTQGRKKTGMHGRGERLSREEIDAIVNYMLTLPYEANPKRGMETFQSHCARCHGEGATGRLYRGAPNLILSEISDIGMARIIRHGHAGTIMGGFKDELSNSEIADIIVWLRLRRYGLSRTFSQYFNQGRTP